jgi:demethylmenaquinone methyltransferase/2-methoxy-6-polyprenyl-1,4-benzoquinol methylase
VSNEYYQPGADRGAKVQALFERIAPRYDLINDLQSFGLHRRWKRAVIDLARVKTGDRALDVCCGTGDLAKALARRGAEVVGLDFCQRMLDFSGTEAKSPNPTYVRGDAQELPFPDKAFDVVTVGYGLRNLSNWKRGLEEMARVGRPGARIIVLDFGKPDNALWRGLYFTYLRLFVPVLGLVFCRNAAAYAYILESLQHYPAQHGVDAHMRHIGLTNVRIVSFLGGVMTINYGEVTPAAP